MTIRGAQQIACLQPPSPGAAVRAAGATKVLAWAQPLAGMDEFLFRPIYFDTVGGFWRGTLALVRDWATARGKQLGAEKKNRVEPLASC